MQSGGVGSNAFHKTAQQIQMAQHQNTSRTTGGASASSSFLGNEISIGGVRIGGAQQTQRGGNEMVQDVSDEGVQETLSEEVFTKYQSRDLIPGARIHPGDIVEAASLAAIPLPKPTYDLAASIPRDLITTGKFSRLQLEGILYACQRHLTILPNGSRAGCFIGDAAGVGKGRQIAGIVLDNFARGRTKHVWFSISSDLKVDAQRDVHDIGCHIKVIEGCQQIDKETKVLGLPKDLQNGVIFSTYSTLVSSTQRGGMWGSTRKSRLDQLISWCGGDSFDGCLIFDECHKAKHFVPGKEEQSTKVAAAVVTIQRMLPKARVLYCSATGVSDVKNMAFMERLGIWGEGAAFKSFENFLDAIHKRGLGVAEMLAMEMKASGTYVSRGLSFREAEFVTMETDLIEEQIKMYDTAAHVWNELKNSLEAALGRTNTGSPRVWSFFWSCHQRFFKQLCLGVKVPKIVKEAKQALEDGYCVVIGLQTTGEASMDSERNKHDKGDSSSESGFVSVAREILLRFINQYFPTVIIADDQGPRDDNWSLTAKTMLLDFTKKMPLPNSPLDDIIDQLGGVSVVAEMTGRRGRMIRDGPNTTARFEPRTPSDSSDVNSMNVQERNSFMCGKKLVAIISDAASTGISLHADARAKNQRRRLHLTIELPWSADKAVQQMGRSHRSNQTSGPVYKLLTTNLGGERRFAASVARRLQTLGALTQGDRRAATGADLTQFNFDTPYGRSALRTMYASICNNELAPGVLLSSISAGKQEATFQDLNIDLQDSISVMGVKEPNVIGCQVIYKDSRDVSKFLNRILGLRVEKQNLIFNYFYECLQAVIATAKKEGKYTEGLVDISASSVEMVCPPKTVFKEANTSTPTQLLSLSVDRGLSWQAALERSERFTGKHDGFYCSKRDQFGKKLFILATQKDNSSHLFKIARPNTGVSVLDEDYDDLKMRYVPITKEEAEEGWNEQYEATKEKCIHGSHCKNPGSCTIGTRLHGMDLLCGGIVTLLSTLEMVANKHAPKLDLSKTSYSMRVVRVALSNDKRVIGIRYPECLVELAEEVVREQKLLETLQAKLMKNMANGITTPVSLNDIKHQPKLSTVEAESPVNPKLVKKAMTAPVTLKSFFKATPRFDSGETQSLCVSSKDGATNASKGDDGDDDCVVNEAELDTNPHKLKGSVGSKSRKKKRKSCESVTDKSQRNTKSTKDEREVVDCTTLPSSVKSNSSTSQGSAIINSASSNAPCSPGTKRPLQDNNGRPAESSCQEPSAKKPKPTSSSVDSIPQQEVNKSKVITCPICNEDLPSGTLLTMLNRHIDACLLKT
ncbi:protein FORGETTER 1-like [Asterias rubens]|uniref:protein FORGETTER 1-like n=1 Tax=Asterias rubens TaxID=7604 RepID=UPI0014559561|nr:protein FORGETTER 1-like [Asterias rubens]XP_033638097.1 protein FORGETTER 1-like [Asterias rubens]